MVLVIGRFIDGIFHTEATEVKEATEKRREMQRSRAEEEKRRIREEDGEKTGKKSE